MKPNDAIDMQDQHAPGGEAAEPTQMPLGVGNFEDQVASDPLAGDGSSRKRLDGGSLLIVIVILVAAAGLFSMRTLAKVTIPAAGASEFDETVEGFLRLLSVDSQTPTAGGQRPESDDTVLQIINEQYTERQVPLDGVQRNPFIIWAPVVRIETRDPENVDNYWEQERAKREEEIRIAAERFVLKSVLMGSTPLANLSDKIVRVGESILVQPEAVEFRVSRITPGAVTLVASDPRFELTLELDVFLIRE